jgi:hypothetical protein
MSGVFLIQADGSLSELIERPYDTEDVLQSLLAQHPSLLAGDLIDPEDPRRWLLVSREVPLASDASAAGRWAVDHLFIDQDGIPTVVEVKRSSDTRIRREVIGQIIEYASNAVVYWPIESLRARFEQLCSERAVDPVSELTRFCGPEADLNEFWSRVHTNLQAGRVRLVLVADVIPQELRRMVEFLKGQMDPAEILAVEVRQFVSGDIRTMVPRVYGQTEQARTRRGSTRSAAAQQWDEPTFFAALEAKNREAAPVAKRLLEWVRQNSCRIYWGRGSRTGSFVPVFQYKGEEYPLFAVYTYHSERVKEPSLEVYFQHYASRPPFDREELRADLMARLNAIPGIALDSSRLAKRPSFPLVLLAEDRSFGMFCDSFAWFFDQIRAAR